MVRLSVRWISHLFDVVKGLTLARLVVTFAYVAFSANAWSPSSFVRVVANFLPSGARSRYGNRSWLASSLWRGASLPHVGKIVPFGRPGPRTETLVCHRHSCELGRFPGFGAPLYAMSEAALLGHGLNGHSVRLRVCLGLLLPIPSGRQGLSLSSTGSLPPGIVWGIEILLGVLCRGEGYVRDFVSSRRVQGRFVSKEDGRTSPFG